MAFLGICRASCASRVPAAHSTCSPTSRFLQRACACRTIRADVDPETNPFGLQWDCYSDTPQRIELEEPVAPTKREGGL
ncbi:DUF2895 family protein [Pseudomonas aeruginosa]